MNARIREAKYEDGPGVFLFLSLRGRGAAGEAVWMRRWEQLYQKNPALVRDLLHPIGWIVEGENDEIGGYIGNIIMPYSYGGRSFPAAALTDVAVDEKYRAYSLALFKEFFTQKNISLLVNSTANEASGRVFGGLKVKKLHSENYDVSYYFLMRPISVFRLFFGRRLPFFISAPLSVVCGALFLAWAWFRDIGSHVTLASGDEVRESGSGDLDEQYDAFWAEIKRGNRLMAVRSREILRWHFENARFLAFYRNGTLMGYAVADMNINGADGIRRIRLADIVARTDDPHVIAALIQSVRAYARNAGADLVVAYFLPRAVRKIFDSSAHIRRRRDGGVYAHIADTSLSSVDIQRDWYATCIDGDSSLGNHASPQYRPKALLPFGALRRLKRSVLWGGYSRGAHTYLKNAEMTGSPWNFELKNKVADGIYVNLSFDLELALNGQFWRGELDTALESGRTAVANMHGVIRLLNEADVEYNVQICAGLFDRKLAERTFFNSVQADCIRANRELFLLRDDIISELMRPSVEIGVHSFSHRNFADLTQKEANREVEASIAAYKASLGAVPAFMAYPDNTVRYEDVLPLFSLSYRAGDNASGPTRTRIPNGLYWAPLSVSPRDLRGILTLLRSRERPAFLHLWQHFTEMDAETVNEYLNVLREFRCKIVTARSFFSLLK